MHLVPGDLAVFYVGRPECVFGGWAVLDSALMETAIEQQSLTRERRFDGSLGVRLTKPMIWETGVPVKDLLADLQVFHQKKNWGGYLQGGILRIPEEDFTLILGASEKLSNRRTPNTQ